MLKPRSIASSLALATLVVACSTSTVTSTSLPSGQVSDSGALHLVVSDAPTGMGILFTLPNVTASAGAVHVTETRYGSRCANEITGEATVVPGKVTLHITSKDRPTVCTAEARKISYAADISGVAPGGYDVQVVRTDYNGTNVLTTMRVGVP